MDVFCFDGVSTIVIGPLDCFSFGMPVLILVLLLALKYMEGSLFRFSFCFGDVLRVASIVAASLAGTSGDSSFPCPFSRLPVESLVLTIFWLPVEAVFGIPLEVAFWLPVEPVCTVLACFARGAFSFSLAMAALGVPSLAWMFVSFFHPQFWPQQLGLSLVSLFVHVLVVCLGFLDPWLSFMPQCAPSPRY